MVCDKFIAAGVSGICRSLKTNIFPELPTQPHATQFFVLRCKISLCLENKNNTLEKNFNYTFRVTIKKKIVIENSNN